MVTLHDAATMDSDGSIHHPLLTEYIQHGLDHFEREEKRREVITNLNAR